MKCRQVRPKLNEYDLGALPEREAELIQQHLEGCAACLGELQRLQAITAAMGTLPQAEPPANLWPGVAARLRPRRHLLTWLGDAWEPALAVAAALLLAFVLLRGIAAPAIAPPDLSFQVAQAAEQDDDQLVGVGWQRPFADETALGVKLALLETEGDES